MPRKDKIDQVLTQLAVMDERQQNMAKDVEAIQKTQAMIWEKDINQDAEIQKISQTVYGADGRNGMRSDVKMLKQAFYGLSAIITFIGLAIGLFKDTVINFFKGNN